MVRHKNRYIVVEISEWHKPETAPLQLTQSCLVRAVMSNVQTLHGDFGVASITSGFMAKYCNENTRIAIFRARHGPHKILASTLPCIQYIDDKRVKVCALYTGATIKQCFRFILNYQQRKVDEVCAGLKSDEEKAEAKKKLMNLGSVLDIQ